jgi:hypothetical protein
LKVTVQEPDGDFDLISIMIPIGHCDVIRKELTSQYQIDSPEKGFQSQPMKGAVHIGKSRLSSLTREF